MKITFLNANSLISKNKTGVQTFQTELTRHFIQMDKDNHYDVTIAGVAVNKQSRINIKNVSEDWIKKRLRINRFVPYRFTDKIPIEMIFGISDCYICDGWMPKTVFKSSKVISVIHDMMSYIYPEYYSKTDRGNIHKYFKLSALRADKIIAVSQTTKNDIIKYLDFPEDKIKVVFNGVNDVFTYKLSIPEDSNIDYTKNYLFYIGDMRKNKNLLNAIKGFNLALNKNNDIYFYIAGSKKCEYEVLIRYVEQHNLSDRVLFLGFVSEKEKILLYQNALALLFISEYEGFGIPIIEAMSAGIPVITSNCSSMKEIADGAALLVDPHNLNEISNAIEQLMNKDIRETYVSKGYSCYGKYTWSNSAKQLNEILMEL